LEARANIIPYPSMQSFLGGEFYFETWILSTTCNVYVQCTNNSVHIFPLALVLLVALNGT